MKLKKKFNQIFLKKTTIKKKRAQVTPSGKLQEGASIIAIGGGFWIGDIAQSLEYVSHMITTFLFKLISLSRKRIKCTQVNLLITKKINLKI